MANKQANATAKAADPDYCSRLCVRFWLLADDIYKSRLGLGDRFGPR